MRALGKDNIKEDGNQEGVWWGKKEQMIMLFEDQNHERGRLMKTEFSSKILLEINILIVAGLGGMDSLLDDQMAGMKLKIRVIIMPARIFALIPYIARSWCLHTSERTSEITCY